MSTDDLFISLENRRFISYCRLITSVTFRLRRQPQIKLFAKGCGNEIWIFGLKKRKKAIRSAFIELRAKKSLEKITVKELCSLAYINKSTFYAHYEDIYALSDAMEQETVASIISGIDHLKDYTFESSDVFSRELCLAFMSQISLIKILFSGKEQNHLGNRLDRELKKVIFRKYPEYEHDPEKNILFSYCIQGAYHAYLNNPEADTQTLVSTIEKITKCLRPMVNTGEKAGSTS